MTATNRNAAPQALEPAQLIESARRVLDIEASAVAQLRERIDGNFVRAVQIILACEGRVVVSGMGKSGHVARKIAATMASTGTPAFFVHPGEASHGDLGMIAAGDVVIALSNSGESEELLVIVPLIKRQGARLIAITGNPRSRLASLADAHLDAAVAQEACSLGLAPTASTTAALALGDALAVTLLEARGFGPEDFARSHPGGSLGRRLLTHVEDVMRTGEAVPRVPEGATFAEALLEISRKGMGMTAVLDAGGRVAGIFTDGDLRRLLEKQADLRQLAIRDVMHRNPRSVAPKQLAAEAASLMEQHRISQLLVVDGDGRLVGALNTHDLMQAKVI
ncbi:MAG TPA: KpsF/GutQ family sugar-phosphate isomerase [Burkholderiales bacterium]|jgi:arabinose-5-phosphate isomerase|nr:KpsF/GutQ family sugar-phosphate isomerase [Burkholderiales bacterium]